MRKDQVALVQASFQQFVPVAWKASEIFYDELFRIAPETRALFPSDMSEQRKKLIQTLTAVVNGLSYPEAMMPQVRALGARHKGYRTKPEHYDKVGQALIHAFQTSMGSAFTPPMRDAWLACYGLLSSEMKQAA